MKRDLPGARAALVQRIHALFLILVLSATLPAWAAVPPETVSAIDRMLAASYPPSEPGAAVLVVKDGDVLLRKGYGMADLELGVPIEPDMAFEIGSVTKQFTAAAILMLAERGQLRLDDDVTRHLPDFPTQGRKITIEHLLTHTSGIPSYTGIQEWQAQSRQEVTVDQLIGFFRDKPLEFEPGERWAYNNSAYVLLGAILEKLSGKTYEQFVEEEIFKPLGMKGSRYGNKSEVVARRASGYEGSDGAYRNASYLSMTQPYSAGSLISTVDDLAAWDRALSGEALLKKSSLERMFTPVPLASGLSTRYGYGWSVFDFEGRRVIEHGGDINGYASYLLRIPEERLLVVILSNNPEKRPRPDILSLRVAAHLLGKDIESRPTVALSPEALDEYVGVYSIQDGDAGETRIVTREGTRLFAQRTGGVKSEVLATARDDFFYKESENLLRFERDAQGKVTGMRVTPRFGPESPAAKTDQPVPAERQAVKIDPSLFDAYAGVYQLAPEFEITISREGDRFFEQATGQAKFEIFPASETRFFLKQVDAEIEFVRGEDGKVARMVLHQGGREMPGKRVR
jgi:D-alanyl-D-alanine carboxypeptidase